jgi:hypothetical protein
MTLRRARFSRIPEPELRRLWRANTPRTQGFAGRDTEDPARVRVDREWFDPFDIRPGLHWLRPKLTYDKGIFAPERNVKHLIKRRPGRPPGKRR